MSATTAHKWPKVLPPLTPEQKIRSDEFMKLWHEVLASKPRYGLIERFNHNFPVRHSPADFRTTLEVGIYQALRFDYDPARATVLALLQLLLCGLFVLLAGQYAQAVQNWPSLTFFDWLNDALVALAAFAAGIFPGALVVWGLWTMNQSDLLMLAVGLVITRL